MILKIVILVPLMILAYHYSSVLFSYFKF